MLQGNMDRVADLAAPLSGFADRRPRLASRRITLARWIGQAGCL